MKERKKLHERIEVVYEDQDLIIINKAAGILSYPVEGDRSESVIQLIRRYWKFQNNPHQHLYLMHRLDKETSGLIVFAKSSLARDSLRTQFEKHTVVRAYLAITNGIPRKKSGRIETLLGRDPQGRRAVAWKGKEAITQYRVVAQNESPQRGLVRCYLQTGRTHQVRIHLAYIGTPVVGDSVYGRRGDGKHLALCAEALGIIHPRSQSPLVIRTSMPSELRAALGARSNRINFDPRSTRQF